MLLPVLLFLTKIKKVNPEWALADVKQSMYLLNRLGSKPGTPGGPKGSNRAPGGMSLHAKIHTILVLFMIPYYIRVRERERRSHGRLPGKPGSSPNKPDQLGSSGPANTL